jgi:hypothetical protein
VGNNDAETGSDLRISRTNTGPPSATSDQQ